MTKIKIAYRQIIDSRSSSDFEKKLFNDSFNEFYLQSQAYSEGGRLKTFQDLISHNPKANSLHYKVGFSVGRYISELKNITPGLRDSIGKPVAFENHEFQLLDSDISNKDAHKIAILYISNWFELFAIAGNFLVVGNSGADGAMATLTIQLRENLSVVECDKVKSEKLDFEVYDNEKQLG